MNSPRLDFTIREKFKRMAAIKCFQQLAEICEDDDDNVYLMRIQVLRQAVDSLLGPDCHVDARTT